jgi:hypothetical protein
MVLAHTYSGLYPQLAIAKGHFLPMVQRSHIPEA